MINYKGIFYQEDSQKHYYEGGAHFKYKHLFKALEAIKAKREQEKELKIPQSRNKSLEYYQEKNNLNNDLLTIDNNKNIFESPKNNNKDTFIEQLLSLDKSKLSKKRKIKLKEIKSESKQKDTVLYTENNRYNNYESKIKNNSIDINFLKEKNNKYYNKILLTEEKSNDKKSKNILNLKLANSNHKSSFKTLNKIDTLPKIESLYYNNLSKKNLFDNNSNSNMATNSTNIKSEFNEVKNKMEYEINKNLNKPDFHFFSLKKILPQINGQSMSTINYEKTNNLFDRNRLMFTINNRNNREESISNQNNNIKSFNDNINSDEDEKDNILRNINLKKNNYKILKLGNENKEKNSNLKSKLFPNNKEKKSLKKSLKKIIKNKGE